MRTHVHFDMDTLRNVKLNEKISFPNVLNLKDYMTDEILKRDAQHDAML